MGNKKKNNNNDEAVVIPLDLEEEIEEFERSTEPATAETADARLDLNQLKEMSINQLSSAAKGLGVARTTLSRLINGKQGISPDMAVRLSMGFGSTPETWLRMQMNYDLAQVRKRAKNIHIKRFESA